MLSQNLSLEAEFWDGIEFISSKPTEEDKAVTIFQFSALERRFPVATCWNFFAPVERNIMNRRWRIVFFNRF